MLSIEQIEKISMWITEVSDACEFLKYDYSQDEPSLVYDRITQNTVHHARLTQVLAEAKRIQDEQIAEVYDRDMDIILRMSATVSNRYIKSQCSEINFLVNWCKEIVELLNQSNTALVTQVGYLRQQMSLNKSGY